MSFQNLYHVYCKTKITIEETGEEIEFNISARIKAISSVSARTKFYYLCQSPIPNRSDLKVELVTKNVLKSGNKELN